MSPQRARLTSAAALMAAMALATSSLPALAQSAGDITVTGGSVARIVLTIADDTAEFGSNLDPDGTASDSTDTVTAYVDGVNDPSFGACYRWDGSGRVRSNVIYDMTVSSDADVPRLGFMTSAPTDYAACSFGEAARDSDAGGMFPAADPAGGWAFDQTRNGNRQHTFSLGLDVRWEDDPDANLADTDLTITVQAAS
jgi:hypothetical protein